MLKLDLEKKEEPGIIPASWEVYMQVKKQQLEMDLKQLTG